jgi:outer membrane protein TolC
VADAHRAATEIARVAGTATAVDVLAAQADLARRRSEHVQAEAALASAQEALGALLGIDGPVHVVLPDLAAPEDPAPADRLALVAADAAVDAARSQVRAAWWRQLPTLTANATALGATVPFPTGNEWAYKVGLEATWTLYDGGLRYGLRRQAAADLAAARAVRTATELRVAREVRDADRDLRVAREQLRLAQEQARLATEAASVAQRGLSAGTVSPLQARDTDIQAFSAEVGVAGARARVRIAEAASRRARGLDQRW